MGKDNGQFFSRSNNLEDHNVISNTRSNSSISAFRSEECISKKEKSSTKTEHLDGFNEIVTTAESNISYSNTCQCATEINRKRTRDSYLSLGCINRGRAFDTRNGRKNHQVEKTLQ